MNGRGGRQRRHGEHCRRGPAVVLATMLLSVLLTAGPAASHEPPDLQVEKDAAASTINAGDFAVFTIRVTNIGKGVATDVFVDDVLPDSGLDWTEDPDQAACTITDDPAGDILSCKIEKLGAGDSFVVQVKALTDADDCGDLRNVATASTADEPAELLGNNQDDATITVVCEDGGDEGCTPGFWKNHTSLWDGLGTDDVTSTVQTTDGFNATFGVTSGLSGLADSVTLLDAVNLGGGGLKALARHAAAAAANADADSVDYEFSLAQVIALYRDAVGADPGPETVSTALAKLSEANERTCPLG